MQIELVPTLQIQRDLYDMPRGMERFREYINTMMPPGSTELKLPLMSMNPMGKDHLPVFLDRLIGFHAEDVARDAASEAAGGLSADEGNYRLCVVVSDDLKGGWTNRFTSELSHRGFEQPGMYKRGWIVAILWTSETYTPDLVREEVRACIFRAAYAQRHGATRTLGALLAQEAFAMSHAGATRPSLDDEDLAYTREVLAPLAGKSDRATVIAGLFGDAAARELGYEPLGLSARAGLALALADGRAARQASRA